MTLNPRYASHILGSAGLAAHHVELYLDYVCPFSRKLFDRVYLEVVPRLDKSQSVRFSFCHQIQPWHPSSTLVAEAALAVGLLHPDRFWDFSRALFSRSTEFYDESCVHETRDQIYVRLSALAHESVSADPDKVLDMLRVSGGSAANAGNAVTKDVKYFVRFSRHKGIHVSPTVVVNGIVDDSFGSGTSVDEWLRKIAELTGKP